MGGTLLAVLLGYSPYEAIAAMFNIFIGNLQHILIPNVLYQLIKAYTGNLKGFGRGTERRLLVKVHVSILTILVILYVANIILGSLFWFSSVIPEPDDYSKPRPLNKLSLAKCTIQFLVSLEIIVEMFIFVRLPKRVSSQVGSFKRKLAKLFSNY